MMTVKNGDDKKKVFGLRTIRLSSNYYDRANFINLSPIRVFHEGMEKLKLAIIAGDVNSIYKLQDIVAGRSCRATSVRISVEENAYLVRYGITPGALAEWVLDDLFYATLEKVIKTKDFGLLNPDRRYNYGIQYMGFTIWKDHIEPCEFSHTPELVRELRKDEGDFKQEIPYESYKEPVSLEELFEYLHNNTMSGTFKGSNILNKCCLAGRFF
jgi:hypothetical protein